MKILQLRSLEVTKHFDLKKLSLKNNYGWLERIKSINKTLKTTGSILKPRS